MGGGDKKPTSPAQISLLSSRPIWSLHLNIQGLHLNITQGRLPLVVPIPPSSSPPTHGPLPGHLLFRRTAIVHLVAQVKKPGGQ